VLHRLSTEAVADLRQRGVARFAFHAAHAHLDELMRRQGAVDLGQYRIGEAPLADMNDRIERMRAPFERLALRRRQLKPPGMSYLGWRIMPVSRTTPSGPKCTEKK
jgi:hypothetical protein